MQDSALRVRRSQLRRLVDRYRRPLAACLAGLAAAVTLLTLRTEPAVEMADAPASTLVRPGDVRVPVALDSGAIAAVLSVGDVIDLVAVADDGRPTVVAPGARVVQLAAGGTALAAASAVILVAVAEADALPLSAAAAGGPLSVVIHRP